MKLTSADSYVNFTFGFPAANSEFLSHANFGAQAVLTYLDESVYPLRCDCEVSSHRPPRSAYT